ncbi:MAG: glycosyltransferase [Thermoanaerobaculia bacterium]
MLFVRDFLAGRRILRAEAAPASPAVSVILPTWRRFQSGLLRRAVESVLTQGFRDLELIVVDDGSTDGTEGFLLAAQQEDPRIVYVRHELNCGLPALRVNEGIELARGRYLAFQFDDDEWLEGALEALVDQAERCPEPSVVFGTAILEDSAGGEQSLPPGIEVNLLTLSYQNRIANNSVLLARELIDQHGLYDPHVGLRRLCDWDLWIRYARRAPFVAVDRPVARVRVAADPGSIGLSVPGDVPLFRFLNAIPRDRLLTPARWRDYEVDALRIGEVEVLKGMRERLQSEHVDPFHRRLRWVFPHLPPPPPPPARPPRSLLFSMDSYYGSFDLCMGHYDLPSCRRGVAKLFYQPLFQIGPDWGKDVDLLLLVRTITEAGPRVATEAAAAGIPAGYYMDDDLLHLHEYGPPFDLLAPGTPRRESLVQQIAGVDAVWVTSPVIAESVRPLNPRIVPHNGSVPESWLPDGLPPRGQDGPVRIGYVGGAYRVDEFRSIWEALRRLSEEYGDRAAFEFWGLDVSRLPPLASPVTQRPYLHAYREFIEKLRRARFDILLTPLLEHPRPRLAKSPSKYYQTAVAGSLGIFSDVPQYAMLPHGVACLKAANDAESWYMALKEALTMPAARFDALRRAMVEHVRLEYTERAQLHLHEAAVRATEFHSATRARRGEDGRPRVAFAPGLEALRDVAREYGVEPVDPTMDVPLVEAPGPAVVPRALFERGLLRVLAAGDGKTVLLLGNPTPAAIEAVGLLRNRGIEIVLEIRGAGDPAETVRCRRRIHELGLQGQVRILRAVGDFWSGADLLLDLGGDGWREALAAGVAVVSNSSRDLVDGTTAVLFEGAGPEEIAAAIERGLAERARIVPHAYRLARGEFHPQRAASELFALLAKERTAEEAQPAPAWVPPPPTRAERLRHAADQLGLYRPASRLVWSRRRKRVLVTYDHAIASVYLYWEHALPRLQEATGRDWLLRPAAEVRPDDLYTCHAVVSVRGLSRKSLEILQAARRFGCLTVYDTDDDLLRIDQAISDPDNPWRRIFGAARPEIEAMLRLAGVVKVYGDSAVPLFRPYNPNVAAIRPYQILDGEELPPVQQSPEVTVGFLGSFFKDEEFGPVTRAILRLLDEGRPLRFEFLGFLPRALEDRPEVSHVPWRSSYPEYRRTLKALEWDLGLAPLRDLEFHRGKNNAKYREYAAAGIPGIYSDAEVYRSSITDRETGLIVPQEDEGAWYAAIRELSEDAGLRASIRRNAFADLRANYRVEDYVAKVAALLGGRG